MIAIEFHEPTEFKLKMAWKLLHKVDKVLFAQMVVTQMLSKHRILTQVAGHAMDVIKILPPLIIGEREVDMFVNALDAILTECRKFPGPMWEIGNNFVRHALALEAFCRTIAASLIAVAGIGDPGPRKMKLPASIL